MADRDRAPGLALVGYRGVGKTTVGRIVADRLGWEFADADAELERRLGLTIPDLFARQGEPAFRDEEQRTISELTERSNLVLSTGGGVVERPANGEALRRFGLVVHLEAEAETLAARILADADTVRPPLTGAGPIAEIRHILDRRRPLYRDLADWAVSTEGLTPAEVADLIVGFVQASGGAPLR